MEERQNNHLYHTNCTTTKKRRIHCRHRTNSTVQYQDFHLILILYNTIGSLLDHYFCGVNLALRFRFISQCRLPECRQKSWRAPLHRLRWLRHHQHYAFDGPCSGCSGWLDNADDVSEIMQRSPVGSRFAVSFCCFNKNENLYGCKEMLYTKV